MSTAQCDLCLSAMTDNTESDSQSEISKISRVCLPNLFVSKFKFYVICNNVMDLSRYTVFSYLITKDGHMNVKYCYCDEQDHSTVKGMDCVTM